MLPEAASLLAKMRRREGACRSGVPHTRAFARVGYCLVSLCLCVSCGVFLFRINSMRFSGAVTGPGGGVQLTSRSGVLKEARSRVVIGENANGEGGLAEQFLVSSFEFRVRALARESDTMTFATDQHGLTRRYPARSGERCFYEFSKTSEGLSSPRILECVSKLCYPFNEAVY